jgi:nucleoside 2-deoxyribosyltransferase
MDKCFLCSSNLLESHLDSSRDVYLLSCPNCGRFTITREALRLFRSEKSIQDASYLLSGVIRTSHDHGNRIDILTDNIARLIESANEPTIPTEAIDRLIMLIEKQISEASDFTSFHPRGAVLYAKSPREFKYFCDLAVEIGFVEQREGKHEYRLTVSGWKRLIEIKKTIPQSNRAFVAMWFSDEMDGVWQDGFRSALIDAGYDPIRADIIEHNEKICDRILSEIRRSGLLVADFTGNRGGVYFEAGFAMGMGIPVIWTCRSDDMDSVHFDTRQYNHIVWENISDLKTQLVNRIVATLPKPIIN